MPQRNYFNTSFSLEKVLKIIKPLVSWLLKCGIGYNEFSQALKEIFYLEAEKELTRVKQKRTTSSLSLLSGLNRRDVNYYKDMQSDTNSCNSLSVPARVISLWIEKKWDKQIGLNTGEICFESLAKEVSQDIHPHSILMELQRLGVITKFNDMVILHKISSNPDDNKFEQQNSLSQSCYDHLTAGVSNIFISKNQFLERNIQAYELTIDSINELKLYSDEMWKEYSKKMSDKISLCHERDQNKPDTHYRFSLGIYQYNEKIDTINNEK